MDEIKVRILNKIDTTENWNAQNPVLQAGELGIAQNPDGTCMLKVGNGSSNWNDLQNILVSGGSQNVTLTQAEYDALVESGEVDEDTYYFIKEG